jgi:opacity protein-like surface antigen
VKILRLLVAKESILPLLAILFIAFVAVFDAVQAAASDSNESVEPSDFRLPLYSLSYIFSFPTASTADFVSNSVSYRGLGVEWDSPIGATRFHLGISFRWIYFRNVDDHGTYVVDNTTATGRLYRSIEAFPLVLHLKYPFLIAPNSRFFPFAGIGVGSTYGRKELDIGALSRNQYGWQFVMTPEAGVLYKLSKNNEMAAILDLRYDAGFGSDAIGGISHFSVALGIGASI